MTELDIIESSYPSWLGVDLQKSDNYEVETFNTGWSCIINRNGSNVLTFRNHLGVKFTTKSTAEKILQYWKTN